MHVALIKENQPDEGRVALTQHACHQLIAAGHCVSVQAGAGVVADSVPELEWQETLNKGRALFRAVEMAERGLDEPAVEG